VRLRARFLGTSLRGVRCCGVATCFQVEKDKFTLFYVLMQVPPVIVKSLNRLAQTGYDRLRLQLSASEGAEGEEEAMADDNEVGGRAVRAHRAAHPLLLV
jgi:hypothetical protein